MPTDRFLIAPFNTGLQTDLKPWLIMDDAFAELTNAYVFRGRVRKRFGSRLMGSGWTNALTEPLFSRLRINLGNTDGSGNISGTVPGSVFKIGQMFSIDGAIFTVVATGTPANMLRTDDVVATAIFNTTTGAYVINGATINTAAFFYPAEPVMGITIYENGPITNQPTYAFDTQFAYKFANGAWARSGTALWHGSNSDYYWAANWRGATVNQTVMFVANFHVTNMNGTGVATDDPIWYTIDGTNWTSATGANGFYFFPNGGAHAAGPFVQTSRIIVAFKGRLVLLNTIENDNSGGTGVNTWYPQRARYSINGSPFAANSWYEPNQIDAAGNFAVGAGFIDASTEEQIISAEFIKDRLIVYFQSSTWELVGTNNAEQPFYWQRINTELGSEATFSTVPFDKVVLTMGNVGVHACNGANVERIDNKIPDEVFEITDKDNGVKRVVGIRDYFTEMVYWTFPSDNLNPLETYPNRVIVYNYKNSSWALNDDCITFFGYFEQQSGETWASTTKTWAESNFPWGSGSTETQFRQVVAGNQEGFTFIIDAEESRNARNMQITNMVNSGDYLQLTIVDHTLDIESKTGNGYIIIENAQGVTGVNGNIYDIFAIIDKDNLLVGPVNITGVYTGGGTASRVSNINIRTKQYNPYVSVGQNVYISKLECNVEATVSGQITVDYLPSYSPIQMLEEARDTGTLIGTSILDTFAYPLVPFEVLQSQLWHPVYFQTDGEAIQFFFYMSPEQITTPNIAFSDFVLHGMIIYTQPITRLQ